MTTLVDTGWEMVVGLEVHCELSTATKLFCGCRNAFGDEPNTNVCPVCLGLPGSLPVVNQRAVETSERYADGRASRQEMVEAWAALDWEPAAYCEWPAAVTGEVGYRAPDEDEVRDKRLEDRFPGQRRDVALERDWCAVLRDFRSAQ